jgi:hypothetical protein
MKKYRIALLLIVFFSFHDFLNAHGDRQPIRDRFYIKNMREKPVYLDYEVSPEMKKTPFTTYNMSVVDMYVIRYLNEEVGDINMRTFNPAPVPERRSKDYYSLGEGGAADEFRKLGLPEQLRIIYTKFSIKDENGVEILNLDTMKPDDFVTTDYFDSSLISALIIKTEDYLISNEQLDVEKALPAAPTEGEYEYIPLDDADVYSVTVTSDGVRLRTKERFNMLIGFSSDVIKELSAGDRVAVVRRKGRYFLDDGDGDDEMPPNYWYKVLTEDGESGYVYGAYLSEVDERRYDAAIAELKKRSAELGASFDEYFQSLGNMTIEYLEKAKEWPLEIRCMVTTLVINCGNITKLPDLLPVFPSLEHLRVRGPKLEDISVLRGVKVLREIYLTGSAISDVSALSTCVNLEVIGLSNTKITVIPDLSRLNYLSWLYIDGTPVKSLKGIETGASISGYMGVSAKNCDLLEDLEPLNYSNVRQIVFDRKNYDRLESWYYKNLERRRVNGLYSSFRFGWGDF